MQDKYYADSRDLLKWGVLIRLAEQYLLSRIIQVAYLRPSIFPMIDIAGQQDGTAFAGSRTLQEHP